MCKLQFVPFAIPDTKKNIYIYIYVIFLAKPKSANFKMLSLVIKKLGDLTSLWATFTVFKYSSALAACFA